jgi:hypothetical protein
VLTAAGKVKLFRVYFVCRRCRAGSYALDDRLGVIGSRSPLAEQLICLAGASWSFDRAAEHLREFCGLAISDNSIRAVCQQHGSTMSRRQHNEVAISLASNIPCFLRVSRGKMHDVNILDELPIEPGAFYIMDKAYIDYARLYRLHQQAAFFLTRAKKNLDAKRRQSRIIDKATGLRSDQTIVLAGIKSSQSYPETLRRIHYFDVETGKRFVFLTNNFVLPALLIAQLNKCRWQIELFFKWIKQHLRIKAFYGTSLGAVRTQIWIAISVYVLVVIVKKELKIECSLSEILQILSVNRFEKTPVLQLLTNPTNSFPDTPFPKQLTLFDF